jgi:hypothetical protein
MHPATSFHPCEPLAEILTRCLQPCVGFSGACHPAARWAPELGHVPRGFVGALGSPDEVKLVIVAAEPGDPRPGERQDIDPSDPRASLARICQFTYGQLEVRFSQYHANVRVLLDLCWPGLDFCKQMAKTWITESVLCSAASTTGPVPHERVCGDQYLRSQLSLFESVPVIALGRKAQQRARRVAPRRAIIGAFAAAPPGCNRLGARPSWEAAAKEARRMLALSVP